MSEVMNNPFFRGLYKMILYYVEFYIFKMLLFADVNTDIESLYTGYN